MRHSRFSIGLVLIQLHPQVSSLLKERFERSPKDFERKSGTDLLLFVVNLGFTFVDYSRHGIHMNQSLNDFFIQTLISNSVKFLDT